MLGEGCYGNWEGYSETRAELAGDNCYECILKQGDKYKDEQTETHTSTQRRRNTEKDGGRMKCGPRRQMNLWDMCKPHSLPSLPAGKSPKHEQPTANGTFAIQVSVSKRSHLPRKLEERRFLGWDRECARGAWNILL